MVVFGIGASTFGPKLMTNAASEDSNAKQRDAFVVLCKDRYIEKLTSALAAATSQPGVRRALEGYWKEVNLCVVREAKNARTGSGAEMKKEAKERKVGFSKVSPLGMAVGYGPTNFYWMGSTDPKYTQYYLEIYDAEGKLPSLHKVSVTKGEGGKFVAPVDLSNVTGIQKGKKYSWQVFASDGKDLLVSDNGEKARFLVSDTATATGSNLKPKPTASSSGERKDGFKFRNSATPKPGETPKPKPTHNGKDEI